MLFCICIWVSNVQDFRELDLFGYVTISYVSASGLTREKSKDLNESYNAELPNVVKSSNSGVVETESGSEEPLSIEALIRREFGEYAEEAIMVAKCESNLRQDAHGDKLLTYWKDGKMYGDSIGVFQIRTFPNRPDRELLFDAEFNIKYAKKMFDGSGWQPWTCKRVLK